jgi:hypothetical protein
MLRVDDYDFPVNISIKTRRSNFASKTSWKSRRKLFHLNFATAKTVKSEEFTQKDFVLSYIDMKWQNEAISMQ